MRLQMTGSRGILTDNSLLYLLFLNGVVVHADPEASINVDRYNDKLHIIIKPSVVEFKEDILKNVLSMHKLLTIKTEFAKSTKKMHSLIFYVSI